MRLISARRDNADFKKGERQPDKFEVWKKDRTQGSFLKKYTYFSFRIFRGVIMNELIKYVLNRASREMKIPAEKKNNMFIKIIVEYLKSKMTDR